MDWILLPLSHLPYLLPIVSFHYYGYLFFLVKLTLEFIGFFPSVLFDITFGFSSGDNYGLYFLIQAILRNLFL